MPVYVQHRNTQVVRGPPSAVRAVLPEPQAEQATHASFPISPAMLLVALVGTLSLILCIVSPWEGEADSLKGVALHSTPALA